MLHYAVVIFFSALIAALFGFGIATGTVGIATLLFFMFVTLASGSFLLRVTQRRAPSSVDDVRMFAPLPGLAQADPARLREHFSQCRLARGRLHRLHCAGEWLSAYLAPRFASCLVLLIVLVLLLD